MPWPPRWLWIPLPRSASVAPQQPGGCDRVRLGRRSRQIAIGVCAAMAPSAGFAYAASSGGSTVITACELNNIGTIRLIQPGRSGLQGRCSNLETQISWNQQGPAGDSRAEGRQRACGPEGRHRRDPPAGRHGPDRPAGPRRCRRPHGLPGPHLLARRVARDSGLRHRVLPSGQEARWRRFTSAPPGTPPPIGAYVASSGPLSDGSGWTGAVTNTSSQTVTVTIYATCVDAPPASRPPH